MFTHVYVCVHDCMYAQCSSWYDLTPWHFLCNVTRVQLLDKHRLLSVSDNVHFTMLLPSFHSRLFNADNLYRYIQDGPILDDAVLEIDPSSGAVVGSWGSKL